jgi:c(7)-type cytochrome triheme protein
MMRRFILAAVCMTCLSTTLSADVGMDLTHPVLRLAFLRPAPSVLPLEMEADVISEPSAKLPEHRPATAVPNQDIFYDPDNPDLHLLQKANQALAGFPLDGKGFVDWMRALREGLIQPRASLKPGSQENILDLDVILRNTKEMPYVRFPHRSHTLWLDCQNCHPDPFVLNGERNRIQMADILRGKFCGKCHDRVAFITWMSCNRCHSVPQNTAETAP